ncbi:MAG TPA: MgtC/SapB family protein [Actinomycetes bacterium]|jgi:putative Mg2+ transporter-C (MgtC) family protein|nr:MgtC/SapB family protein [Actinomycetes bacterium]
MAATPGELEQLARLALAAGLGGAIGAERELSDQPAGLRTHMLLSLGACLFTLVSAFAFGGGADPSRLAAQIVTGIGFLGGGAILRHGASIRGLTTAASIWATSALGVTVGIGRYILSVGAAVLILATLVVLRVLRNQLQRWSPTREELSFSAEPGFLLESVVSLVHDQGGHLRALQHEQGAQGERVVLVVRFPPRHPTERFVEALTQVPGVREVEWEG